MKLTQRAYRIKASLRNRVDDIGDNGPVNNVQAGAFNPASRGARASASRWRANVCAAGDATALSRHPGRSTTATGID